MTETATPPPADAAVAEACPRCGAALRPDQDWCLTCGAAVTTHVAGAPGWRTPVAIVGVVLLLAAAGLVVAFLELSDDADRVARAPVATPTPAASAAPDATPSPTPSPSPSPDPDASPTPSPGPTSTPNRPGSPSPTTSPGGAVGTWPAGEEAWTVVLRSAGSRAEADDFAREQQSAGRSVGILDSDDYSSLRGGYFVVFSGQYDGREEAQKAADALRSSVPQAYARFVKPR